MEHGRVGRTRSYMTHVLMRTGVEVGADFTSRRLPPPRAPTGLAVAETGQAGGHRSICRGFLRCGRPVFWVRAVDVVLALPHPAHRGQHSVTNLAEHGKKSGHVGLLRRISWAAVDPLVTSMVLSHAWGVKEIRATGPVDIPADVLHRRAEKA
jgi:hypothetical protein